MLVALVPAARDDLDGFLNPGFLLRPFRESNGCRRRAVAWCGQQARRSRRCARRGGRSRRTRRTRTRAKATADPDGSARRAPRARHTPRTVQWTGELRGATSATSSLRAATSATNSALVGGTCGHASGATRRRRTACTSTTRAAGGRMVEHERGPVAAGDQVARRSELGHRVRCRRNRADSTPGAPVSDLPFMPGFNVDTRDWPSIAAVAVAVLAVVVAALLLLRWLQ